MTPQRQEDQDNWKDLQRDPNSCIDQWIIRFPEFAEFIESLFSILEKLYYNCNGLLSMSLEHLLL